MKVAHIEVANYGVVEIPLPPKKYRTNQNLMDMAAYAVSATMNLVTNKTADDFRLALDNLGMDALIHKHIYKLDKTSGNRQSLVVYWTCDCGSIYRWYKEDLYKEMTHET